ncbi:MAG: helix-turn-helix domain-containing protein [Solobacterium sp.]|nr:helix-turn-helix domain-containing protein [Solobacterium sp.]
MTPQQLNDYLFHVTESEKKYKAEGRNTFFDTLEKRESDNPVVGSVYILNNVKNDPHRNESATMYFKKNSRFCVTPYHVHDWIELNYMYSGNCVQTINGREYRMKQGQCVLIDKDTPHEISFLREEDILYSIMIQPEYLNSSFFSRLSHDSIITEFFINAISEEKDHRNYIFFHSENSRRFSAFMNELVCELIEPSYCSNDIANSLFNLVLCELILCYSKYNEIRDRKMNTTSISSVLIYIEDHFKTCTLSETADHFNLNPTYLSTLIKQKLNITFKDLVQKQKLYYATSLLKNTKLTIVEVAHEAGYENMNFFYRKFFNAYGCTPKEYRHKQQETKTV